MAPARTLMVQGTASGVGKSLLAAALCRVFTRDGLSVRPFKAQNMALNAAATPDGGEIGRAQALQALACRVPATRDMNPILLKPEADSRAQVVLHGDPVARLDAGEYHRRKRSLWPDVAGALDRLRAECDLVVIEGAGSPAEVNLRDRDLVNMRVARHAGAPVLLVGDIDRGGVFAALLGTLALLRPAERRHVRAMVVNNFRGDRALFDGGVSFLERRSRLPVLGVVPHLDGLRLPEEDSLGLDRSFGRDGGGGPDASLDVAVVRLPRISNFDDCDALLREPGLRVRLVDQAGRLGDPDLVVLPGSKATRADLDALRARGLDRALVAAHARGTAVLGICGGFQLLGARIDDPGGSDHGEPGTSTGLGLLPTATCISSEKVVREAHGRVLPRPGLLALAGGADVRGYEIHAGRTEPVRPPLLLGSGDAAYEDGATSEDGWVVGTHLHGLLDAAPLRRSLLRAVAARRGRSWTPGPPVPDVDEELDRLADAVAAALDMNALRRIVAEGVS
jgi:adenosylcobyric acid synthase